MTAQLDAYALRPEPIQAHLYTEANRRAAAAPEPSLAPAPTRAPSAPAAPSPPEPARRFLACPDCAREGHPGRIGTRRNSCPMCNRFAAAVRASIRRRLLALLTPEDQERMREAAEAEVFARVVPTAQEVTR